MHSAKVHKPRYDTVEYIKKLRHAQFSQEQSEVIAQGTEAMIDDVQRQTWQVLGEKDLATRSHVNEAESRFSSEMALLRKDMQAGFERADATTELLRKDMQAGFERADTATELLRKEMQAGFEKGHHELQLCFAKSEAATELLRREMQADAEAGRNALQRSFEKSDANTELLRKDMYANSEKSAAATELLREEMQREIARLKFDLIKWMFYVGVSSIMTIVGLLKYLP